MAAVSSAHPDITLAPVSPGNWRDCVSLGVTEAQGDFVSPVSRYLAMCAYGDTPWQPLAVESGGHTVGFVMHGIDTSENSFWIGGLVVDAAQQRRGIGRAIVEALVERARAAGHPSVALSYLPSNDAARRLYAALGFVETGEREDDEVVARLQL